MNISNQVIIVQLNNTDRMQSFIEDLQIINQRLSAEVGVLYWKIILQKTDKDLMSRK